MLRNFLGGSCFSSGKNADDCERLESRKDAKLFLDSSTPKSTVMSQKPTYDETVDYEQQSLSFTAQKIFSGLCKDKDSKSSTACIGPEQVRAGLSDLGIPLTDVEWNHVVAKVSSKARDRFDEIAFCEVAREAQRLTLLKAIVADANLHLALERIVPQRMEEVLRMEKSDISCVLGNVGFIDKAAETLCSALKNRSKGSSGLARALNAKFISDGVELCEFGADQEFHGGLDEAIGLPDPFILKGIFYEHLQASTSKTYFLTPNYGLCTTPERELAFLLGREEDFQYLHTLCGEKNGPTLEELDSMKQQFQQLQLLNKEVQSKKGSYPGEIGSWQVDIVITINAGVASDRILKVQSAFIEQLKERLSQLAKSIAPFKYDVSTCEEILLRLGTIEMLKVDNQVEITLPLSHGEFVEFWQDFVKTSIAALVESPVEHTKVINVKERKWSFVEDPHPDLAAGRYEKQGRRRPTLRELMEDESTKKAGLRVEEVIVACEYTGPMYTQMNRVLRRLKGSKNNYTTTLHCLVSATIKISRQTVIPNERKLWRGLGSRVLNEAKFFDRDARGTKGGVERGFLSTTTKMEVALQYSGHDRHAGTVLEFDFGKVDCPAKIDSLSQYPGEGEMLFGPLSYLEVVGNPRLEMHNRSIILVVPIRINCNLKALTIEEIIAKRQRAQISLIQSLMKEIAFDFSHIPQQVIDDNRGEGRFQLSADTACRIDTDSCCIDDSNTCCVVSPGAASAASTPSKPAAKKGKSVSRCSSMALNVISTVTRIDPLLSEALCSMEELWKRAKKRDEAWFNHDENFRHAWNEALDRKNQIVSSWWLRSLLTAGPSENFRHLIKRLKERSSLDMLARQASEEAKSLKLFQSTPDEVNEDEGETTPLMVQARLGNVPNVKLLLLARAEVGAKDVRGKTALHIAAEWCQPEVVRTLIDLGAGLNADGRAGLSILRYAEQQLQISKFHPHPLVRKSFSRSHCDHCEKGVLNSHTYRCDDCNYDLCLGCFEAAGRACAKELKLLGADGWTPLMIAAEDGDVAAVERLLAEGMCDINAVNHVHRTAIHLAAEARHMNVMALLCEAKADPNFEDRLGLSASDLIEGPEMDQMRAARGWTPLITAAHTGDAVEVSKLIEAGADVHARTRAQRTALHMAARGRNTEVVRLLAEGKADVQARDEKGRSVLELAKGSECRRLLMSLGADGWNPERVEAETRRIERILCADVWLLGGSLPRTGVVGLFFARQSSAPCLSFLSVLADFYHKMKERRQEFEVIYLPFDDSEEAFSEFYGAMPWLALPYQEQNVRDKITSRHRVRTIPTLLLLDAASGDVICTNAAEKMKEDTEGRMFPWIPLKIDELLGRTFLGREGEVQLEGKYVGILFAGRWCPACQRAVPRIVSGYNKVRAERDDFEMVFCSSDQSQEMFDDFYRGMPWLALPFKDRAKEAELSQRYEVRGIPTLILLTPERDEFEVSLRQDLDEAPFPWAGKQLNRVAKNGDDSDDDNISPEDLLRAHFRGNDEDGAGCPVQ